GAGPSAASPLLPDAQRHRPPRGSLHPTPRRSQRRSTLFFGSLLVKIVALALAIGLAALGAAASLGAGPVYGSREEMLARAFPPPAAIERKTFFLTAGQRDRASRLAAAKIESSLV